MTQDNDPIRLAGVAKSYREVQAVAGVDMTVRAGETVALLGPNGAGKSTTIAMLLSLLQPDAGDVELFGGSPVTAVEAGRIGVMLQGGDLPSHTTVAELVGLARAIFPQPLPTAEILDTAGLADLATRRVDKLSGGQHQRAKFAFALAGDPDLLVLDEPTAGMDAASRQRFWDSVRHRADAGCAVLFATHYLAEADEYADRVVMLSQGAVVADGSSSEIRKAAGTHNVSFALDGTPAEGLDRLPGVRAVEVRGDRATLSSDDADSTVAALFAARGRVRGLEVSSAGLTDAFLTLTTDKEE